MWVMSDATCAFHEMLHGECDSEYGPSPYFNSSSITAYPAFITHSTLIFFFSLSVLQAFLLIEEHFNKCLAGMDFPLLSAGTRQTPDPLYNYSGSDRPSQWLSLLGAFINGASKPPREDTSPSTRCHTHVHIITASHGVSVWVLHHCSSQKLVYGVPGLDIGM